MYILTERTLTYMLFSCFTTKATKRNIKSQNLKNIENKYQLFIIFKHLNILKYSSYNIISMCKQFSSFFIKHFSKKWGWVENLKILKLQKNRKISLFQTWKSQTFLYSVTKSHIFFCTVHEILTFFCTRSALVDPNFAGTDEIVLVHY